MKRSLQAAISLLAMASAAPVLAADYPEMRPAYQENWQNPDSDLRFEFGTRYWLSWGRQDASYSGAAAGLGDIGVSVQDQTHIGELHGKIEDLSTQTYLSGKAGLGLSSSGTYAITPANSGTIGKNSTIGYAGLDYGWLPFGNMREGAAIGGLIGYQYWQDSPDIGTGQYAASFAGGVPSTYGSAKNQLEVHALRLGIKGQATYNMFDVQGEVAAIPYAHMSGTIGGSSPSGFNFPGVANTNYERAPTTVSGRGYGVMAEGMVGYHPTENLTLRIGGRAWYLEGQLDSQFTANAGGANQATATLPSTFARLFRYGLLLEATGRF